ncbi:T9SS type A sorting domain-containing protein, partial [Winogradskyella vincentii]
FDVNSLLVQGGGSLCASLDVAGAPVHVEEETEACTAEAGRLRSSSILTCLSGGVATISANQVVPAEIPTGYEQLFVLTNAFNLTILDVSSTPEFVVYHAGFYRIHSLVYNPDTLDLSIVDFGTTTAFDVLPLLQQGGGEICASLDAKGTVTLVLPGFFCNIFGGYYFGKDINNDKDVVNTWVNQYDSYNDFEKDMLNELTVTSVYPNPVKQDLNVNTILLDEESVDYTIVDMQGRMLKQGVITTMSNDSFQIDMSNLSNGTYILQLKSEFRNYTTKVQLQR